MRSVIVALVISAVPVGGSLAGLAIQHVEWEQMFLLGGLVPLALFFLFGFLLPESPKYMAQHPSLHKRLARSLNRLLGEQRFQGDEQFVVQEQGKRSSNWLATIWNSDYAKATFFIWIAFSFNSFVLYLYTNYLKVLLTTDRVSDAIAGSVAQPVLHRRVLRLDRRCRADPLLRFAVGGFGPGVPGRRRYVLHRRADARRRRAGGFQRQGAGLHRRHVHQRHAGLHVRGLAPTPIRPRSAARRWVWRRPSRASARCSARSSQRAYLRIDPLPGVNLFFWFVAACAFITTLSFFLIPSHIPSSRTHDTGGGELEVQGLKEGARP